MPEQNALKKTQGGLVVARIIEIEDVKIKEGGKFDIQDVTVAADKIEVACLFNPYEYTVTKANTFKEFEAANAGNSPRADFQSSGPQTLQLHLVFDTYGQYVPKSSDKVDPQFEAVTKYTSDLWQLMAVKKKSGTPGQDKDSPPMVAFVWGKLYFVAYITQMTQKFTLFAHDGTPVRAEVDITFTQYVDLDDYPKQNPTSGGGPIDRVWRVRAGDRLDTIASNVYGSAAKWRLIAHFNQLDNPAALRPGQQLLIPFEANIV